MAKKIVQRYQGGGQVQKKGQFDTTDYPDSLVKMLTTGGTGAGHGQPTFGGYGFTKDQVKQMQQSGVTIGQLQQMGLTTAPQTQTYNPAYYSGGGAQGPSTSISDQGRGQLAAAAQLRASMMVDPTQPPPAPQQQDQPQDTTPPEMPTVQTTPLTPTAQGQAATSTMNVPQASAATATPLFNLGSIGLGQQSQLPQGQNPLLGWLRGRPQGQQLPFNTPPPPQGGMQMPAPPQYPPPPYSSLQAPQPGQNYQQFWSQPTALAGGPQPQQLPQWAQQPQPQQYQYGGFVRPPDQQQGIQRFQGGGQALQPGTTKDPQTGEIRYVDPAFSSQLGLGNLTADQYKALGYDPINLSHSTVGGTAAQIGALYQPSFLGAAALGMPAVINLPPSSQMNNPKGGVQTQPGGVVVGTNVPQTPQGPWLTNPSVFAKAAYPTLSGPGIGWTGGEAGPLTPTTPANAAQMPQMNITPAYGPNAAMARPMAGLPPGANVAAAQGPPTDKVPAVLTPGEFVMNRGATQMFGPQLAQMNQMAGGQRPPMAPGMPQMMGGQAPPMMPAQGQAPAPFTGTVHTDPYLSHAVSGLLGLPSNPWHNPDGSPTAITQAIGGGGPPPAKRMQAGGYVYGDQRGVPAAMPGQGSDQSQGSQQTSNQPQRTEQVHPMLANVANNLNLPGAPNPIASAGAGGGVTGYQPPPAPGAGIRPGMTVQPGTTPTAVGVGTTPQAAASSAGMGAGLSNQQRMNIAGGIQQGFNQAAQAIAQSAQPWQWIPAGSWANPQQYQAQEQQKEQQAAQLSAQRTV